LTTVSVGVNVFAGVKDSVSVIPGASVRRLPGVWVHIDVEVSPVAAVEIDSVTVEGEEVHTDIIVGVAGGESVPNTTPTIIKFATMLVATTRPTIRLIVMRIVIFFSQYMGHSFSSGLGH